MIVMVTGGARSGKSSFAERWCMKHAKSGVYIATAQAFDDEMKERIALHQAQRHDSGFNWVTLEEPVLLHERLCKLSEQVLASAEQQRGLVDKPAVLVDCLTLWLTNVLLAAENRVDADQIISTEIDRLVEAVSCYDGDLVLVTNEVGSGIVPEYPLGRLYRDLAGIVNRRIAEISDQVFLVTAGIAIELKSREYRL